VLKSEIKSADPKKVVRIRFSRKGPGAYLAHLDMMRIFERAINRADLCCEYTQGFNPRPIMTFALPLGVGVETIDDYADIVVCEKTKIMDFTTLLNQFLPEDIEILGGTMIQSEKVSLMAQVSYAGYSFYLEGIGRFEKLLTGAEHLDVVKHSKEGNKTIDVKKYLIEYTSHDPHSLYVIVKAGSKENLRPDLLLQSFVGFDGFSQKDAKSAQIIRTGTFIGVHEGSYVRPM
jgi:radical SAM-linked protein